MLRFFKSSHPAALLLIPLLAAFNAFSENLTTVEESFSYNLGITGVLLNLIPVGLQHTFFPIIVFILLIVISALLIRLDTVLGLSEKKNYLAPTIFLLLGIFPVPNPFLISILLGIIVFLPSLIPIYLSNRKDFAVNDYFHVGSFFALSAIFCPVFLIFILFPFTALLIIRPLIWNEWMSVVFGFVGIYILFFFVMYLSSGTIHAEQFLFVPKFSGFRLTLFDTFYYASQAILMTVLSVVSIFFLLRKYNTLNILRRKMFQLFFFAFVLSFIAFSTNNFEIEILLAGAIPLSFLFTYYFVSVKKSKIVEILFILMVLAHFAEIFIS
jgi:hypothetical protein